MRSATLDGESAEFSGASYACAYTAGVMAKLLSGTDRGMDPEELKNQLLSS